MKKFSSASSLKLNIRKSTILCLYKTCKTNVCNIPVKHCFKYLAIHITNYLFLRQQQNFAPAIKKTKLIFNLWLQRDLSMYSRTLLTKAEGVSRLVYPALSLSQLATPSAKKSMILAENPSRKINTSLKKAILGLEKTEEGPEALSFFHLKYTFKMRWLANVNKNPDSFQNFIQNHIFSSLGGSGFLLNCNFTV